MRKTILLFALLPMLALAEGTLTIQPQANNSVRFFAKGGTGSGGDDILGIQQLAERTVTLSVSPSGISQCDNGDIVLEGMKISVTNMLDNNKVQCGLPLLVGAESKNREIPLRVSATLTARKSSIGPASGTNSWLPIGSVSAVGESGESQHYPLYLDLSVIQDQMAVLTASFMQSGLFLGDVGDNHNVSDTVQLRVSKTAQAGSEAIAYSLSFESSQRHNNQYRMRASTLDQMIPYQILIAGRQVLPDGAWRGMVPAGSGTSDVVDIQFKLEGKQTRGMAAGISLQDTVTAVITPDS